MEDKDKIFTNVEAIDLDSIRSLGIAARKAYKKEVVGNHLLKFLLEKGLSRKEFEEMINKEDFELIIPTNHNSVNQWISGEKQIPTDKLYIFANMFGHSVDDFFKTTAKYDEYRVNERVEVIEPFVKIYGEKMSVVTFRFFTEEFESISLVASIPEGFVDTLKSTKEVWMEPEDLKQIIKKSDINKMDIETTYVAELDDTEEDDGLVWKEINRFFVTPSDKQVYPYVGRLCALESIKYLINQQEKFNVEKKSEFHQENINKLKKLYEIYNDKSYSFGYPKTQTKPCEKLKEDYPELSEVID